MLVPFRSQRLLLERAIKHLNEFESLENRFRAHHKNSRISEVDAKSRDKLFKIKVNQECLEGLSVVLFDIANCMRSALDHAVFDAARAIGGNPKPKYTKFPFGKTLDDARKDVNRYKSSEVPEALRPYLLGFEPYEGGKESIWELNELRNLKVHQTLQPFVAHVASTSIGRPGDYMRGGVGGGQFQTVNEWNADKSELTYVRIRNIETNIQPNPILSVTLGEHIRLGHQPTLHVFREFSKVIERVVGGIESEACRLSGT